MAPSWFELLAWVALGLGFASALVIVADIVVLGNWQHMAIMDIAFPLTALYMGPIALWAYFARGRRMSRKRMHMQAAGMNEGARDSLWQVSLSDSHCGAGCVLGDVGGEWIVWATGWVIGSTAALGPEYILDLPLAWIFGILFQYFVIAPLRGQLGWMALAQYVIWKAPIDSSSHWCLMQIGMMLGFVTSWPVNRWLLRRGIKEPMPTF